IGATTHFFYMMPMNGYNVFLELVKIKIPMVSENVDELVIYLDDLIPLAFLHNGITKMENTKEKTCPVSPSLPFACLQTSKKTMTDKRKMSVGSIASKSSAN
ncbi:hypothetical protein DM01DRAFT_1295741, partial [Hesseltinella vesiculosa]